MLALMKGWMAEQIDRAGGPKKLALELHRAGYPVGSDKPYSERTVSSWREKSDNWPPPAVLWAVSQLNGSSQDAIVLEGALKRSLTERLQDHEGRIAEIQGQMDRVGIDRERLDAVVALLVELGETVDFDVLGRLRKRDDDRSARGAG